MVDLRKVIRWRREAIFFVNGLLATSGLSPRSAKFPPSPITSGSAKPAGSSSPLTCWRSHDLRTRLFKSLARLEGVHPDLVRVVKGAIEITPVDFTVTEPPADGGAPTRPRRVCASQTMKAAHQWPRRPRGPG